MQDEVYPWRELEREVALKTRVFDVSRRQMVELSGDKTPKQGEFVRIEPPDWVNVVAITQDQELVLIEQWRHGTDQMTLEIPGGMIDPGEALLSAAKRELEEETGFTAADWTHIGSVEPNSAIQSNRCHTYLAVNAQKTQSTAFDQHERCRLILKPVKEAARLVASGAISHALVVVGLYFYELSVRGELTSSLS